MDNCSAGGCGGKTFFDSYNEFADACGIPRGEICKSPNPQSVYLAKELVGEEYARETLPAVEKYLMNPSLENFVEVADGFVDTVYVLFQFCRILGVPFNEIFEIVHSANMAKVGPDGKVIRREDGKILKPEGWVPPDTKIWEALYQKHVLQIKKDQGHKPGEVLGD